MLVGIPAPALEEAWPNVAPHLARAIAEGDGEMTLDDLKALLAARDAQLWAAVDGEGRTIGAGCTEIAAYPRRKVCAVFLWGAADGRRGEWRGGLGVVERWARLQGCDAVEVRGRKGWARVLPGYEPRRVILRKEL
jgi:hypothetical protein